MKKAAGLLLCLFSISSFSQDNLFNIIYSNDFEHNNLGYYDTNTWDEDWYKPGWRDSDHRHVGYEYNVVNIISDNQTGSKVMKFDYPKGSVGPQEGGDYWNSYWGTIEQEVYFSYNVKFKPGFDFNEGGKLPGINGGPMYEGARQPIEEEGFSCILMFHKEAQIIFYLYHQDNTAERYADVRYWNDAGKHQFFTDPEKWYNITIRVVMNTFTNGKANYDGILEGYIDGKLIETWNGLRLLHDVNEGRGIEGMIMASFFGGNSEIHAAQRDEWAYFDDFYLFTYKEGVSVPRGNTVSPAGRVLQLPNLNKSGVPPATDTQKPTVPSNLISSEIKQNSVKLSWTASTDNV